MKEVYIVTNPGYGWDCIIGVYDSAKKAIESQGLIYMENKDNFDYYGEDYEHLCLFIETIH